MTDSVPIDGLVRLAHYCETFAKEMLSNRGEFYPFGAFLNGSGQFEALAGDLGQRRPMPRELYEFLEGAVAQMAADRKLTAYALAANADVPAEFGIPYRDAIRVHIEAPGYSRYVYVPYRLLPYRAVRRFFMVLPTTEFGEVVTVDTAGSVFLQDVDG